MKPLVTAIVISHDQPELLSVTLLALQNQSRPADKVILVDTSSSEESLEIANDFENLELIRLASDEKLPQILNSVVRDQSSKGELGDWLWLLHDDSAPEKFALENLLLVTERSPSVGLVGPKQLDWHNPREILQQGLTLAPGGEVFSWVAGELDQAQHDDMDDVMAVGTAGLLVKTAVYQELEGLDSNAPPLAADVDFSIRARMAGHRVVVAPSAKVLHVGLSLAGKRSRKWLKVSSKAARRRASIHLQLAYLPLFSALALWLVLPLVGLIRAVLAIAKKRPDRILTEFGSAIWGWLTLPVRFSSRIRINRTQKIRFSKLAALRASAAQVRANRNAQLEADEIQGQIGDVAAQGASIDSVADQPQPRTFLDSGAGWLVLALAAASFAWWPRDLAATGGGLLPLSEQWINIFNRAGASYQNIGLGYFAPSDPFVWVLATLGLTTFWAPSLSLVILVFLVKPLAFIGAWRLAAAFSGSSLARNLAALVYALWPMASVYQGEVRLPVLIAYLALPWFVLAVARVADVTKFSSIHSNQLRWTWVALAGLLLAAIAAAAPIAAIICVISLAIIAIGKIRKFGLLLWIPLPTAAIFGPTVIFYLFNLTQPLALIADPGIPQSVGNHESLAITGGPNFQFTLTPLIASAAIVLVALLALLLKRTIISTFLWLGVIVLFAASWLAQSVSLPAVGVGSTSFSHQSVPLSAGSLMICIALLLSLLIAFVFDDLRARRFNAILATITVLFGIVPTLAFFALTSNPLNYSSARAVPSIVSAEAKLGSSLKLLSLNPTEQSDGSVTIAAELVNGDGVQLEDVSLSYRFAVAEITAESQQFSRVSQLVADLASVSGVNLTETLQELGLGYILITNPTEPQAVELAFALDSVSELESVGLTDYGQLWRVRVPNQELLGTNPVSEADWSITKGVQLAILLSFGLLALPSRSSKRRQTADSEIFVDANEDAQ